MEFLIIGIVTALNLIFIKTKFNKGRYEDGLLDLFILIALAAVFAGSYSGLVVATVSSMIISIYLYFSPPTFLTKTVNSIKSALN